MIRNPQGSHPGLPGPFQLLLALLLLGLAAGSAEAVDLDGRLLRIQQAPTTAGTETVSGTAAAVEDDIPVFLLGDPDSEVLRDLGIEVRTRAGGVLTATVPRSSLRLLGGIPGLTGAVAATRLEPRLDVSIPEIRVHEVRQRDGDAWSGLTGEGVLIGIVDSGLDPTHEDFLRPDGSTRVVAYWDQTNAAGPGPGEIPNTYGTEWTAGQIDAGTAVVGDNRGHGTHVLGIAAGDGSAGTVPERRYRYAGVAPEAGLIVVETELFDDRVADGVAYVFAKAEALGLPAVVNLSLGNHSGPHDGTVPLDLLLDGLAGPGRLMAAAAGNEGDDAIHAEIGVAAAGRDSVTLTVVRRSVPPGTPNFQQFAIDAYYYRPEDFEVTVVSPAGSRFGPFAAGEGVIELQTAEGTLSVTHENYAGGSNRQVLMDVTNLGSQAPVPGDWRLVFEDLAGAPMGGEIDFWSSSSPHFATTWDAASVDLSEEISTPGSARQVITVGAYNSKRCWDTAGLPAERCVDFGPGVPPEEADPGRLSRFTSRGPTRDGRQKPEIVAPGLVITSAYSAQTIPGLDVPSDIAALLDPDQAHMVRAGTSMSTPHVTGTLALALQLDPDLTPDRARELLLASARTDAFTGEAWNALAGHGKLDARALLDRVPVVARSLQLEEDPGGGVVLRWEASPEDPVAGFILEARPAGSAEFTSVHRCAGRGPHVWRDRDVLAGTAFRLRALGLDGSVEFWAESTWGGPVSGLRIHVARPNPFRDRVQVSFSGIAPGTPAVLEVLDLRGRLVRRSELPPAAAGVWNWDGTDDGGAGLPAGVYWLRIRSGELAAVQRLVRVQ